MFLQGASAAELTELVTENGGTVTHSLHIIDAVGAKLTGRQLTEILESPLVSRFIDDLADSDQPGRPEDEEDAPPCRVRGHIELDFLPDRVSWRLYNKYEAPAALNSLQLSWPETLGKLTAVRVGDSIVDPARYSHSDKAAIELTFEGKDQPVIEDMERLDLVFSNQPTNPDDAPPQREFTMEASFVGPCSTKLVPGYENNHEDYYYNTAGGVDELHRQGLTGKGVTVAIIDSGLWEHELLVNDTQGNNRLLATYNAITDTEGGEVLDESGHGTHMASIIANSGKTLKNGEWTGTYKGVAPDANLVAVKVLDRQGLAHLLDIVRAVQWVVDNREEYAIKVLNLSFSKYPRWEFWEDPVNQATAIAWRKGISVVAAAGNRGPNENSIGSPGNLPEIITVGAITDSWTSLDKSDDYIPGFSSQSSLSADHTKPDIVALGGHMTGLAPSESAIAIERPEDILVSGELVSTGTSQASAFVSGVATQVIQLRPDTRPDAMKCILLTSAEPAISASGALAYPPHRQGHGAVAADRAMVFGDPTCNAITLLPQKRPEQTRPVEPKITGQAAENLLSEPWPQGKAAEPVYWGAKRFTEALTQDAEAEPERAVAEDFWRHIYEREKNVVENLLNSHILSKD